MTAAEKGREIAPAKGKLGVLLPGMGAVATTFIAGVESARRGLSKPIGSLTQMGHIRLGKRTDEQNNADEDQNFRRNETCCAALIRVFFFSSYRSQSSESSLPIPCVFPYSFSLVRIVAGLIASPLIATASPLPMPSWARPPRKLSTRSPNSL